MTLFANSKAGRFCRRSLALGAAIALTGMTALLPAPAARADGLDDPTLAPSLEAFKGKKIGYVPFSMSFDLAKGWLAEGGIRNALIVSGPGVQRAKGSINHGVMHVADLMPTMLEVAGAAYPKTLAGRELPPLLGKSWGPVLAGKAESPRTEKDYLAWQLFGNRAVRQGSWKLRWQYKPLGKEDWELFDLAADPAERKDVAAKHPDKVKELVALWDEYVRTNNVVLPSRGPFETLDDQLPARVPDDPGFPPLVNKRQFVPPKDMLAEPKP